MNILTDNLFHIKASQVIIFFKYSVLLNEKLKFRLSLDIFLKFNADFIRNIYFVSCLVSLQYEKLGSIFITYFVYNILKILIIHCCLLGTIWCILLLLCAPWAAILLYSIFCKYLWDWLLLTTHLFRMQSVARAKVFQHCFFK